jgi:hypothetical protein
VAGQAIELGVEILGQGCPGRVGGRGRTRQGGADAFGAEAVGWPAWLLGCRGLGRLSSARQGSRGANADRGELAQRSEVGGDGASEVASAGEELAERRVGLPVARLV